MTQEQKTEKENNIEVGDKVYFVDQKSPMTVKSRSVRYAILTEPFYRNKTVYHSILDFEAQWKAPHNLINKDTYDFEDQTSIDECMFHLMEGKIGLSEKRGCDINIDWEKTEAAKAKRKKK